RRASAACAALQSAKDSRFGSCAAGRIGAATCSSILNLKRRCVRPTADIPILFRLKKPRDTFPSSPLRSCALTPPPSWVARHVFLPSRLEEIALGIVPLLGMPSAISRRLL